MFSGCNGDATRASRDSGDEREEVPLHRAVFLRLNELVAALVTAKVNLNWQVVFCLVFFFFKALWLE